jgi:SAM-dependent methyltransferase
MTTTGDHYKIHLGPVYTWMVGDLDAAFARSRAELDDLPLALRSRVAVDLGAGFGLHTVPLAERGYTVTAVDSCKTLLEELRCRAGLLPIKTIVGDLRAFRSHQEQPADVIVCMGDTLTHLPDFAAVDSLLDDVVVSLGSGGVFATTFRDYVSGTLEKDDRFIAVRSDDSRILTCFLEYGDHHVTVHDLLHESKHGRWQQRISSYLKLRLPPERVVERLTKLGLAVSVHPGVSGMTRIVGVRA